ncbi:NAD(P)/FAD-dependent oxidoreductase [Paraburkholderia phymatum]|uniref:NAD(P)/FAD-dependent oxidoreductase n=1 Tax=Paraburkholderia phymatum TaxID=148447 RepID=A0ACC6UDB6_9BURK
MRIAIIGAGIVGSSLAYHLATRGANVYIFDTRRAGSVTSLATFSYLNAVRFGGQYGELRVKAISYWTELSTQLRAEQLVHRDGSVYYVDNDADAEKMEAHLAASSVAGLEFERMKAADFVARFEPNLVLPESRFPVYRMPGEGWLESVPMIGRLLRGAEDAGATLCAGEQITRIERRDGEYRLRGTRTDITVDKVVSCSGAETANVLDMFGVKLPVTTRAGVTIVTKPLPTGLRHVVYAGKVHFKPDGSGRLVAGRTDYRASVPTLDDAHAAAEETAALVRPWLRGFGEGEIESVRIGIRPIPADGLPVVGEIPGHPGLSVAVMHSGISLSGLVGREHASEILTDNESELLRSYRPERLIDHVDKRREFAPWAPGDLATAETGHSGILSIGAAPTDGEPAK